MAVALGGGWHSREGENRAVGLGILVSLALHAALFLAFPGLLERKKQSILPGPLTARLIPPPVAAPPVVEAPKPQAETPQPQAETPKPKAEAPKPAAPESKKPAPSAKPAPERKPAPQATASPEAKPSATVEAPAVAPSAPAVQSAPPTPAVTARTEPQPAPSVEEAGTIARFRLDLIAAAKRFKRYPRVAMDNNWEGRTDVRIVFGADGKRLSMAIARSSGHEALDRQALDTLSKAFVPVPPALRGKQFEIEIPVIYSLKDENA